MLNFRTTREFKLTSHAVSFRSSQSPSPSTTLISSTTLADSSNGGAFLGALTWITSVTYSASISLSNPHG